MMPTTKYKGLVFHWYEQCLDVEYVPGDLCSPPCTCDICSPPPCDLCSPPCTSPLKAPRRFEGKGAKKAFEKLQLLKPTPCDLCSPPCTSGRRFEGKGAKEAFEKLQLLKPSIVFHGAVRKRDLTKAHMKILRRAFPEVCANIIVRDYVSRQGPPVTHVFQMTRHMKVQMLTNIMYLRAGVEPAWVIWTRGCKVIENIEEHTVESLELTHGSLLELHEA